jgi:ketosteroid isomerase-like protein
MMKEQELLTSAEHEAIMAALGMLAESVKQAYATNDADLYISAFDKDAIVSMPNCPPVRGHAALRTAFEGRPDLPPGATFEVNPLEIVAVSPAWAYEFGTDTLEYQRSSSNDWVKDTMTFLVLIKKTEDGWKTFREVVSADQP